MTRLSANASTARSGPLQPDPMNSVIFQPAGTGRNGSEPNSLSILFQKLAAGPCSDNLSVAPRCPRATCDGFHALWTCVWFRQDPLRGPQLVHHEHYDRLQGHDFSWTLHPLALPSWKRRSLPCTAAELASHHSTSRWFSLC